MAQEVINLNGTTVAVSGTVTATPSGTQDTNVTQVNGSTISITNPLFTRLTDGSQTMEITPPSGGSITGNQILTTSGFQAAGTSLTAATTGSGTTIDFGAAKSFISAFILVNGTVTGGTVGINVSLNGTDWARYPTDLVTGALGTGVNAVLSSVAGAFRYARAEVRSAITGGGTVTVTINAT